MAAEYLAVETDDVNDGLITGEQQTKRLQNSRSEDGGGGSGGGFVDGLKPVVQLV